VRRARRRLPLLVVLEVVLMLVARLLEPAPAAEFRLVRSNYPERCAPERLYPFA
jgi:hypothetical protein